MELALQIAWAAAALALLAVVAAHSGLRPRWREALVLAGYVLFAVAATGLWRAPTRLFLAGDDPTTDAYTLMRVSRNLLSNPLEPFVGNLGYPEPHSVLFADPGLGLALLVLPLRALTDNAALIYNVALLLALTLTAYAFYRLALRLSGHTGAALFAGIAVAFMSQQTHSLYLGHLIHLMLGGFALLILALISLVERPRGATALAAAAAFFFQASTGGYWALFATLIALLVAAWGWRAFRSAKTWVAALAAAGLAALLLWPYLSGFADVRATAETGRPLEWAERLSTDVGVHPFCSYSYLWRHVLPAPTADGGRLFPGILTLVFATIGLLRRRDRYTGLLLLLAGVFFVLSLGPYLTVAGRRIAPMPFLWLHEHLPFFGTIRTAITFAVISLAALAVLAARGIAASGLARRPWLVAALVAGAALEVLAPLPGLQDRGNAHVDVYAWLARMPRGGILYLPEDASPEIRWAAAVHDLPMVNIGGLGFAPRWWLDVERLVRREWYAKPAHQDMQDFRSTRLVRRLSVRYLVLKPSVSGYLISHVERTQGTFALLGVTPAGYRLYHVRRGSIAPRVRRLFGDDELSAGPLVAWLRGRAGARLDVRLNGAALAPQLLTPEWRRVEWHMDRRLVKAGANELALAVEPPEPAREGAAPAALVPFELYDIGRSDAIVAPEGGAAAATRPLLPPAGA